MRSPFFIVKPSGAIEKISFEENMVVKYQGKLTSADLKNIVNSEEYKIGKFIFSGDD